MSWEIGGKALPRSIADAFSSGKAEPFRILLAFPGFCGRIGARLPSYHPSDHPSEEKHGTRFLPARKRASLLAGRRRARGAPPLRRAGRRLRPRGGLRPRQREPRLAHVRRGRDRARRALLQPRRDHGAARHAGRARRVVHPARGRSPRDQPLHGRAPRRQGPPQGLDASERLRDAPAQRLALVRLRRLHALRPRRQLPAHLGGPLRPTASRSPRASRSATSTSSWRSGSTPPG